MKDRRFTYDIIRRDSFPTQILIRYENETDSEADVFDSLRDCRKSVNNHLKMDVFISCEIMSELF